MSIFFENINFFIVCYEFVKKKFSGFQKFLTSIIKFEKNVTKTYK